MDCRLLLFGEVNRSLPYFIYAFDRMGRIGIGRRLNGRRAAFSLQRVYGADRVIYDRTDEHVSLDGAWVQLQLASPQASNEQCLRLKVVLETPLRLKFENRLHAALPFHILVRAMLRRVSTLWTCYGPGEPDLDYRALTRNAKAVRIAENRLEWFDWRRYSNRQNKAMLMGGLTGSVTYEGKLGPYLALLETCSKLHIGKQTSFGLGKMQVMPECC